MIFCRLKNLGLGVDLNEFLSYSKKKKLPEPLQFCISGKPDEFYKDFGRIQYNLTCFLLSTR